MGKRKAPFASIIHLRLLMFLFYKAFNIDVDLFEDGESRFMDVIQKKLSEKNVIKDGSRNILYKLFGKPAPTSIEECEGIDVAKLDLLTKLVFDTLGLTLEYKISDYSAWSDFNRNIFQVPEYLNVQAKGYFKFLSDEEKKAVDGFVFRMINEITKKSNDVLTYVVNMWNHSEMKVTKAILQFDLRHSFASYNFYNVESGVLIPRTTMRTNVENGVFKLDGNSAFINLSEENPEKSFLNLCLILNIRDLRFEHLNFLKGIMTTTSRNGTLPVSLTVILEKVDNFKIAVSELTELHTSDEIAFDLIEKQLRVEENRVDPLNKLDSNPVFELCKKVSGVYVMVFPMLTKVATIEPEGKIGVAVCQIEPNGRVKIASDTKGHIECFIENAYVNFDLLCISHFINSDERNPIKIEYCLKIIEGRTTSTSSIVEYLEGCFATIYNKSECLHGDIVFKKALPKYNTFEECVAEVKPGIIDIHGGKAHPMYEPYLPTSLERLKDLKKNQVETNYESVIKYEEEKIV